MPSDFTVIMRVRHRFGDNDPDVQERQVDWEVPLVGLAADFAFSCPNVDSTKDAVLEFQHRGTTQLGTMPPGIQEEHPVTINGVQLAGGIPGAPFRSTVPMWATRVLVVEPGVLREDNVLHIESTTRGPQGRFDDFTIDNVVIYFQTRGRGLAGGLDTDPTVSG